MRRRVGKDAQAAAAPLGSRLCARRAHAFRPARILYRRVGTAPQTSICWARTSVGALAHPTGDRIRAGHALVPPHVSLRGVTKVFPKASGGETLHALGPIDLDL